jgi:hypothetical protein
MGQYKFKFTEQGFATVAVTHKWKNIANYWWDGKDRTILRFALKQPFLFLVKELTIPLSLKQKEAANQILSRYLGQPYQLDTEAP